MVGVLRASVLAGTGRGVRVAVIDSGVNAAHAHVQGVSGGVGIDAGGHEHADFVDLIGHGTAVTAVIREKAPEAELFAVKVFDQELATTAAALVAAVDWATAQQVLLINLSLGTLNVDHESQLEGAIARARTAGSIVVAAAPQPNACWLPGALPGVVSVSLDWTLARDECRAELAPYNEIRLAACGYPRPIPGVPPHRNLKGVSFAVANATGMLARLLSGTRDHLAAALGGALAADNGTVPSS